MWGISEAAVSRGASSGNSMALIKSARAIFLRLIENRKRKGEGEREGGREGGNSCVCRQARLFLEPSDGRVRACMLACLRASKCGRACLRNACVRAHTQTHVRAREGSVTIGDTAGKACALARTHKPAG